MRYEWKCDNCGSRVLIRSSVADRDVCPFSCACLEFPKRGEYRRLLSVPNIIGTPYHLQDGNRFRGDTTDYLAYRRRYDKRRDVQEAENREFSTIQAQMTGAEIVKAEEPKPLIEMYREAGGIVRG